MFGEGCDSDIGSGLCASAAVLDRCLLVPQRELMTVRLSGEEKPYGSTLTDDALYRDLATVETDNRFYDGQS